MVLEGETKKHRTWARVSSGPSGTVGTRQALMNRNGQGIGTKSQSDHRGRRQGTYTLEHGVGRPGVGRDKDMETGIGHRHTGCEHKVGTRWDAKLLTLLCLCASRTAGWPTDGHPEPEHQSVLW